MGEVWTGGASNKVTTESSGEDPRATVPWGLFSNRPHPRVNKTKQQTTVTHGSSFRVESDIIQSEMM